MSNSTDHNTHSEEWVLEQLAMYGQWVKGPSGVSAIGSPSATMARVELIDPITEADIAELTHSESVARNAGSRGTRLLWVAAASMLAIGLAAWAATGLSTDEEQPAVRMDLVLDGETVLSTDPLVVLPVPAATPQFDTSELGEEFTVEPATALDPDYQELIDRDLYGEWPEGQGQEIIKVTLLGRVDGKPWLNIVTEGPFDPEKFRQDPGIVDGVLRFSNTVGLSGTSAGFGVVERDSMEFIAPGEQVISGLSSSSPTGWFSLNDLPPRVSVVSFVDSDNEYWMRPVGGFAVFFAEFDEGERWTVTAYDENGAELDSKSEVARYAADGDSTNPKIGQVFDDVEGLVGGDGRPSVIALGAEWCAPCNSGYSDLLEGLATIEQQVNVYAKAHYTDPGAWPTSDDNWPYELVESNGEYLNRFGSVPLVVLLDGDNKLVAYSNSLTDLQTGLEDLGIDLGSSDFWN